MPMLVKGAGYRGVGNVKPLDESDPRVLDLGMTAVKALRASVRKGQKTRLADFRKSLSPSFASQFGMFLAAQPGAMAMEETMMQVQQALAELGKNITLTSPLSTGFVPYDLVAPARLLYPFYAPMRTKIPRTQGQGTARLVKAITAISGSGGYGASTGAPIDASIGELLGSSLGTYPIALPGSGTQTSADQNIPYKFFGITEALSWLAQFAGQGFEDIASLANLILMQEGMLAEEYQILSGTGTAISAPAAPTLALRTAGSNETAVPAAGSSNSYYVRLTATDYFGETAMGAAAEAAVGTSATSVIDVTVVHPRGSWCVNVYITAAAAAGSAPAGRTSYFLVKKNLGATKFTLQGPTLPSTGTNPPTADSGTSATTRFEGLMSVLDGHAVTDAAVYPSGFLGGYVNKDVGKQISITVMNDALQMLWSGDAGVSDAGSATKYRADPAEAIAAGGDLRRLADDVIANKSPSTNYTLFVQQSEVNGIRAGAAVTEYQNPITRSVMRLLAHPYFPQGSMFLMSYQLPTPNSNVANAWENVMVQDYISIAWPVIDVAFRYSMFWYGALVGQAPFYSAVVGGLQNSDTTPYS